MTITIALPKGRGKPVRGRLPWARGITAVAPNATSGYDYEGDWLVYGAVIEAAPYDIVAVQDADLDGAVLYILDPHRIQGNGTEDPAKRLPARKPKWVEIASHSGKLWAGFCAVAVREWLALTPEARADRLLRERVTEIEKLVAYKPMRVRNGSATYYAQEAWATWYANLTAYATAELARRPNSQPIPTDSDHSGNCRNQNQHSGTHQCRHLTRSP